MADALDPFDAAGGWFSPIPADAGTPAPDDHNTSEPEVMPAIDWDEPASPVPALGLAQELIGRGCKLIPVHAGSKRPIGDGWQNSATGDAELVRAWLDAGHIYGVAGGHELSPGRHLVIVDLDVKHGLDGPAELAKLATPYGPLPETFTVATPSGGRHLYFATDFAATNSPGGLPHGIDIRGQGGQCVGPGCLGSNGQRYEVMSAAPIADAPTWLANMLRAGGDRRAADRTPAAPLDQPDDIAWARHYLEQDARAAVLGRGNNTVYEVACRLVERGLDQATATGLMWELYNPRCEPPWAANEAETFEAPIRSAYQHSQNRPASKSTAAVAEGFVQAVTIDGPAIVGAAAAATFEVPSSLIRRRIRAGEPRPLVRMRIKDVLPATGSGMIFGPPSAGKSTLVLDLAAHLSRGADWFGRRTRERAGTLILACEGAGSLGTRLDALGADGGPLAIEAWDIVSLSTTGLASLRPELERLDASWREKYGFGVGLVVLDTISASGMIDDENANAKVAAALKALADFAGSVGAFGLAVHHPRKDGETFRGAGAFEGNTDLIFEVRRGTSPGTGELSIYKARDAATGALGRFRLQQVTLGQDEDGEPVTACVVAPQAAVSEDDPAADPEAVLADLIRRGPDGDGPNTADTPGGCFRMDEGRSRDSIYRAIAEAFGVPFGTETGRLKLDNVHRKTIRHHLERLNARLVCNDDGRDRERKQARVVLALHPRGTSASDFGDAVSV